MFSIAPAQAIEMTSPTISTLAQPRNMAASVDLEMAVIGTALAPEPRGGQHCLAALGAGLRPEHFADPFLARLWQAVVDLVTAGTPVSPFTLRPAFEQDLQAVGGMPFFAKLANNAAAIVDAAPYARAVIEWHARRQIYGLAGDIIDRALTSEPLPQLLEHIESITGACRPTLQRGGIRPIVRAIDGALGGAEAAFKCGHVAGGVSYQLRSLDHITGGAGATDLVILAGRPGMGKSALAASIALANAAAGRPGVVFSLEMSSEQWAARYMAQATSISADRMRRGDVSDDEMRRLCGAADNLKRLPLFLDDSGSITPQAMRARLKRHIAAHPDLAFVIVDYLQLIAPDDGRRENRVADVASITAALKGIAKEFAVPVFALSQLSRAVEGREDKRPQLADLRESGSIEQDADCVVFIYREEYYLAGREPVHGAAGYEEWQRRCERAAGRADLIVAKNRHGRCDTARVFFDATKTLFHEGRS
jgi:replicative DNA helicase